MQENLQAKKAGGAPGAPETLNELKALAQQIADGRSEISLGKRATGAFLKMLQSPEAVATESISKVAQLTGVDAATLSRLGQRLGYEGYSGIQRVFKDHISHGGHFYVDRVAESVRDARDAAPAGVRALAELECRRVMTAAEELSDPSFDRAADLVVKARRVHILGLRGAYCIAYFLGVHLTFFHRDVSILGGAGGMFAGDINQIRKNDLLIAVSYRPYSKMTVAACKAARKIGVPIVSLTDIGSPIAFHAQQGETLSTSSRFFYDSSLPMLFVAEVLLKKVASRVGKAAVRLAEERSEILKQLDMEVE